MDKVEVDVHSPHHFMLVDLVFGPLFLRPIHVQIKLTPALPHAHNHNANSVFLRPSTFVTEVQN
jgi:hypothetical protein